MPQCVGEVCGVTTASGRCRADATHKVEEEILDGAIRHNLTQYVCCKHFALVMGPAAPCAAVAAAALARAASYRPDPEVEASHHRGWFTWAGVLSLFDRACAYCQRARGATGALTRDHVVPVSKGGNGFTHANVVPACSECNKAKADLTLEEFAAATMTHRYRSPAHWHPRVLARLDGVSAEADFEVWTRKRLIVQSVADGNSI